MLKSMLKKKMNKKGFTLAELLIVVAIIAILVAISMPVFTGQLEKARAATDNANMRAAKAAAVTRYLSEEYESGTTYYYNTDTGKLETTKPTTGYGQQSANKNKVIGLTIGADGKVTSGWESVS